MNHTGFKQSLDLWKTPERVVFVTASDAEGNPHIITVSWSSRVSFDPPMFAISIGKNRSIHAMIRESGEFVIAVPGAELADAVIGCGKSGPEPEDRFAKYGLEKQPGETVRCPLIRNCIVNYECIVKEKADAGDHTVFIGQVKETWVNDHPTQNLLLVGDESGYSVIVESGPYKVGVINK